LDQHSGTAALLFLLPFILSFSLLFVFPALYSLVLSFYRYKGYGTMTYVGLSNIKNMLTYSTMWHSLGNTFQYALISFVCVMVIAFALAVVIKSKSLSRFQRIYKPILFIPQICVTVASSLVFQVVFGARIGAINQVFGTSIPFLTDLTLMRIPIITLIVWRHVPWYFIIFLSGLTSISEDIEDAASIDGASAWQRVLYITIPIMKPIFMLSFINYTISSLKLFTEPNLLMGGVAPMQVAPYLNLITQNIGGANFGMASALGWFLTVVILVITLVQLRLFKEGDSI
jgi:ABC-type sugar transport system permease subunit